LNSREKILKAADSLFGEVGFNGATTREIAELSGVNKALIHYHFKNKETLLRSVLDQYYNNLTKALEKSILENGDLSQRVKRLIETYCDFLSKNRNFVRIVQREATGKKYVEQIRDRTIPIFLTGMKFMEEAETKNGSR